MSAQTITPTHRYYPTCTSMGRALARQQDRGTVGNTQPEGKGHGATVTTEHPMPPALAAVRTSALAALGPDDELPPVAVELLEVFGGRWKYAGVKRDALRAVMRRAGYRGGSADTLATLVAVQVLRTPQAARQCPALVARLRGQIEARTGVAVGDGLAS